MSYSIETRTLLVPPFLARKIGKTVAIVLQQIYYRLEKYAVVNEVGVRWTASTYEQWAEQHIPFLSLSTIKRAIAKLKQLDLIRVEQLKESEGDRTNHYTINYPRLQAILNGEILVGASAQSEQMDLFTLTPSTYISDFSTTDKHAVVAQEEFLNPPEPIEPVAPSVGQLPPPIVELSVNPIPIGEDAISAAAPVPVEKLKLLERLGVQNNRVVRDLISQFGDRLDDAIASIQEDLRTWQPKNITGLFVAAIKQSRKPEVIPIAHTPTYPEGFYGSSGIYTVFRASEVELPKSIHEMSPQEREEYQRSIAEIQARLKNKSQE